MKLLLAGCLLWTLASASDCPTGWTYLNSTDSCYAVYQKTSNFTQAQDYCASRGGNLASITNDDEVALLLSLSPTVPSTSNIGCAQQLLVGGVKTSNTASFTWNDGMPWDAYANSLWATGAPHTGSNADTAQLTLFTYGSNQRDAAATTTAASSTVSGTCCPTNGIWGPWTAASACPTTGTTGTSCGSCQSQNLTRTCSSTAQGCPCSGLNFTNRVCGTSLCTYYNVMCCDGYSPMYTSTNYICGPVPVDTPTTCSSSSFQELSCASGWTLFNGTNSCYHVYNAAQTQSQAQTQCANSGGNLASLTSAAEVSFVLALVNKSISVQQVVVGAQNMNANKPKTYVWIDQSPWVSFSKSLWAHLQPANSGTKRCAVMTVNQSPLKPGKLLSYNCSALSSATTPYVCKKDLLTAIIG